MRAERTASAQSQATTVPKQAEPAWRKCHTLIYVISLDSAAERQRIFSSSAALQHAQRDWIFFSGSTQLSPDLRYESGRAILARGRALQDRELACYSSHYEAWRSFLRSSADQLVVIEDDVQLDWAFLDRLLDQDLASSGINYLKLFSKNMTRYKVVSNDFQGRWLLDCRGFAYGMQAYILTRKGATRFVDHCGPLVQRPVDDELDRSWVHGVPNLTVFPFPAFERTGPSTIGAKRDSFQELSHRQKVGRRIVQMKERCLRAKQRITGFGHVRSLPAYPSRVYGITHVQRELL